eukprot:CAMPEP_0197257614 /NCGR_PEP_ID=MMETSP1429-20130617/79359_1 /TAXON_ID=49237 /ORGANISM="Chaetoceros  sp., Strain UNC1202" /LENGTH=393 /DNA_ID=CAMNT_0042721507 /DNA_START=11 /DNA_END=1192 /DNA_ORIENTATION=+
MIKFLKSLKSLKCLKRDVASSVTLEEKVPSEVLVLQSTAKTILEESQMGGNLRFYGRERRPKEFSGPTDIFTGDTTGNALRVILIDLQNLVDENETYYSRLARVQSMHLTNFEFSDLPDDIGRELKALFPNLRQFYLNNCFKLSRITNVLQTFSNLEILWVGNCPSLTSLSSLSNIPSSMPLRHLIFNYCGITVTSEDDTDWDAAMRSLAKTRSEKGTFTLELRHCSKMKAIPSSIQHLSNKEGAICIDLHRNTGLKKIPLEIGMIKNLKELRMVDSSMISSLPFTLGRVAPSCDLYLNRPNMDLRAALTRSNVNFTTVKLSGLAYSHAKIEACEPYFRQQRRQMIIATAKLQILTRRASIVALENMYRPGGIGYLRVKEEFHSVVQSQSQES